MYVFPNFFPLFPPPLFSLFLCFPSRNGRLLLIFSPGLLMYVFPRLFFWSSSSILPLSTYPSSKWEASSSCLPRPLKWCVFNSMFPPVFHSLEEEKISVGFLLAFFWLSFGFLLTSFLLSFGFPLAFLHALFLLSFLFLHAFFLLSIAFILLSVPFCVLLAFFSRHFKKKFPPYSPFPNSNSSSHFFLSPFDVPVSLCFFVVFVYLSLWSDRHLSSFSFCPPFFFLLHEMEEETTSFQPTTVLYILNFGSLDTCCVCLLF